MKLSKILLAEVFVTFHNVSNGQSRIWVNTYSNSGSQDFGEALNFGTDGRVYVAGANGGTNSGAMLISYLTNGTQNWLKTYPTTGGNGESYECVVTLGTGTNTVIYVAGRAPSNTGDM